MPTEFDAPSAFTPDALTPEAVHAAPVPASSSLTPRQAAFADAYARDPNGAAAAREAGYAQASAKIAAARNLRRSGVLLRIMARRREQAAAREAKRTQVTALLDEATALARERRNPSALVRVAALMMRLDGLHRIAPGDDQMLTAATPDQLEDLLACYEIAAGAADPEIPDPASAPLGELADRAAELMDLALDRAGALPGVRAADRHLDGLFRHLEQGVRNAAHACTFARLVEEAAETGEPPPAPWWLAGTEHPEPAEDGDSDSEKITFDNQ